MIWNETWTLLQSLSACVHSKLDDRDEMTRRQRPSHLLVKKVVRTLSAVVCSDVLPTDVPKAGRIRTTFFDVVSDEVVIDEDVNIPGCTSILDLERIAYIEDSLLRDQSKGEVWKCHDATDKTEHNDVIVNPIFDLSAQVCVRQLSQVSEHTLAKWK